MFPRFYTANRGIAPDTKNEQMFKEIDFASASASDWDVVIAGSSFAAMFFLYGLPQGLRVLVVEKGEIIPWDRQVFEGNRPRAEIRIDNRSGHEKTLQAHTVFGGNSNCWWGQTPRFHPNDFRLRSLYGIGEDWPIGYDEIEPFYLEVERVMQIAGGGTDHIFPRSGPYSFPPHALSRTDQAMVAFDPEMWVPVATARANGGDRPTCCANGICHVCPIGSKFTILNSVERFVRDEVRLLTGAECRAVETEAGRARGVILRQDSVETVVKAGAVALATKGFSNPAILLRSGLGGEATGRYLHEQHSATLFIDIDHKNWFGGSSITVHGYGAYDGPHRSESAAVLIENYNAPTVLRNERGRWTERLHMKLIAEDMPLAENRVRLDEDGEAYVEWVGHSDYAAKGLARAEAMLPDLLPFTVERVVEKFHASSEAHIQGTHRMGRDPARSVVDDGLRVHGVPNLFALGSGVFPTCSPANPTLTLSALSLRAGRSFA